MNTIVTKAKIQKNQNVDISTIQTLQDKTFKGIIVNQKLQSMQVESFEIPLK